VVSPQARVFLKDAGHIRHAPDAPATRRAHARCVVIVIRLDAMEPPMGEVGMQGAAPVPFAGWLGLLRALSELLGVDAR